MPLALLFGNSRELAFINDHRSVFSDARLNQWTLAFSVRRDFSMCLEDRLVGNERGKSDLLSRQSIVRARSGAQENVDACQPSSRFNLAGSQILITYNHGLVAYGRKSINVDDRR